MAWLNPSDPEKSLSGPGSSLSYNKNTYIPFIKKFITDHNIKTIVDFGCGNFLCGEAIYNDLDISYIGYDVYHKIIDENRQSYKQYNFMHMDIIKDKSKAFGADLCILKDILQHWPLKDIYDFLDFLVTSKRYKYILICNCSHNAQHNSDTYLGGYRTLHSSTLPLKKYNPIPLYSYDTKEVSCIYVTF